MTGRTWGDSMPELCGIDVIHGVCGKSMEIVHGISKIGKYKIGKYRSDMIL